VTLLPRPAVVAVVGVLALGACTQTATPDGEESTRAVEETTPISVTIPPERTSGFCAAMIELTDRLVTDDDVDADALILETYRSILPEVPDEIDADFRAVLTELETGVPAPTLPPVTQPDLPITTDPETGATIETTPDDTIEYFFPSATSAQRVNDHVAFACRDSTNNPGPPATAPGDGVDETDDS